MSVSVIDSAKNISFGYNPYKNNSKLVSIKQYPDFEERKYEKPASTGKKWGVGLASFFVSGLGQVVNGQWGKAFAFFLSEIFLGILGNIAKSAGSKAGALMLYGGALAVDVWSIADAVKNAKTEEVHIIPKNAQSNDNYEIDALV